LNENDVHLAPGVPSLESLGARTFDDFFRTPGAPGFERAKLVIEREGFEEIRYPLPGTPDTSGRFEGRPMGAGTGFLILRRFTRAAFRERWRARFTPPRSTSLAEREWNLVCHARANGIGAPEPLAVGRGEGALFAERSFLVLRELGGMLSLRQWASTPLDEHSRERIRRALAHALDKLWSANVWLPSLDSDNILVGAPRERSGGDPDCIARRIVEVQAGERSIDAATEGPLKWGDLPEVVFMQFGSGRTRESLSARRRTAQLRILMRELGPVRLPQGPSSRI
jgi:hypothetical protein